MVFFKELANLYEKLSETSKRLEKTFWLADFLKKLNIGDLKKVVLFVQGRIFPRWNSQEMGISSNLIVKLLSKVSNLNEKDIEKSWSQLGDLGLVAEKIVVKKQQVTLFSKNLQVSEVFDILKKMPSITGTNSTDLKLNHLLKLILNCSPLEAKYLVRTVIGDLRVGIGEGILLDAINLAFLPKVIANSLNDTGSFIKCPSCEEIIPVSNSNCPKCNFSLNNVKQMPSLTNKQIVELKDLDEFYSKLSELKNNVFIKTEKTKEISLEIKNILEDALNVLNDFSELSVLAKNFSLRELYTVELKPLRPAKVMLYLKAEDLKDALNTLKPPVALEYKYDGFRVHIHKDKDTIKLFTRRFEDVTKQFPDVVKAAKQLINAKSYIIDCEVVGYDPETKNYLPFQRISQRIKRKYDINDVSRKFPVEVNAFDILYLNGRTLLKEKFSFRREKLVEIIKGKDKVLVPAKQKIVANFEEAEAFYMESLRKGNEGVMVKALDAIYKPGKRVGYGLKVKPIMETLDLVIVGAEYGEGKRAGLLTSFVLACRDELRNLLEIGKVSSGFVELETENKETYEEMTKKLKELIISESGLQVKVKPEIVIEVAYEEIQKSPTYSSGYALRFPRLVRVRYDKDVNEISSINYIEKLYQQQRGRNNNTLKKLTKGN